MPRTTTETTVDPDGTERHPSFGTMSLGTRQTTGTSLFQSDLNHQRTVVVQIHRAHRQRSNNTDHIHRGRGCSTLQSGGESPPDHV